MRDGGLPNPGHGRRHPAQRLRAAARQEPHPRLPPVRLERLRGCPRRPRGRRRQRVRPLTRGQPAGRDVRGTRRELHRLPAARPRLPRLRIRNAARRRARPAHPPPPPAPAPRPPPPPPPTPPRRPPPPPPPARGGGGPGPPRLHPRPPPAANPAAPRTNPRPPADPARQLYARSIDPLPVGAPSAAPNPRRSANHPRRRRPHILTAAPQPHQRRHRPLPDHEKDTPAQHRLPRLATRRHGRVDLAAAPLPFPRRPGAAAPVPSGRGFPSRRWTRTRRPPARDRLQSRSWIGGNAAALPSLSSSMHLGSPEWIGRIGR